MLPDEMSPYAVPVGPDFFFPSWTQKQKKKIALKQKSSLMGKKISSTFVH